MISNEDIYKKYMSDLKQRILDSYHQSGKEATGKFAEEIEEEVDGNHMKLWGAPHSYFMEKGRGPGGWPPRKAIEEWIDKKPGLPSIFREKKNQFVYLISRKIAREGTKGGDVLEHVIQEWVEKDFWIMIKELRGEYAVRIQNDVVNLIRTFSKAS